MSRKNIYLLILVVVLVGVGIWLGSVISNWNSADSKYTAAYLSTGDIYFGEMSWFPSPHMENTFYLQRSVDAQNKAQLAVVPMKNTLWGSSKTVYLNSKDIVWWSKLRSDSELVKYLNNPDAAGSNAPQQGSAPSGKAATSTAP